MSLFEHSPEWSQLFRSTERFAVEVARQRELSDGVARFATSIHVRGGVDFWVCFAESGLRQDVVAFLSQRFWPGEYP